METNTMNRLYDEIGDTYLELRAVGQSMDLALDDMYECLKMPEHYMDSIRADRLVLQQQRNAINEVMKRLKQIAPDDCIDE